MRTCIGYTKGDGTKVECSEKFHSTSDIQRRCLDCRKAMREEINKARYALLRPANRAPVEQPPPQSPPLPEDGHFYDRLEEWGKNQLRIIVAVAKAGDRKGAAYLIFELAKVIGEALLPIGKKKAG